MQRHVHPVSGEVITGIQLVEGAILRDEDVYDSTTGKWERLPIMTGGRLSQTRTIWVRPQGISDEARHLLMILSVRGGNLYHCIAERSGIYYHIPVPDFDWDTRVQTNRVQHPRAIQELVDCGYLSVEKNRTFVLTLLGVSVGHELLAPFVTSPD